MNHSRTVLVSTTAREMRLATLAWIAMSSHQLNELFYSECGRSSCRKFHVHLEVVLFVVSLCDISVMVSLREYVYLQLISNFAYGFICCS